MLKVHAVQTGWVAFTATHRQLVGPASVRYGTIIADPRWTEWLPIMTWVIEHPEGVIVIDTGESSRTGEADYFNCDPGSKFFFQSALRFKVSPEEEIGARLQALGIPPSEVRWVILTHTHSDHADGLEHFPKAQILVARGEYTSALKSPRGDLPCRWPAWFEPTLVDYAPVDIPVFGRGYSVTQAGDVIIVSTPGHSADHQSVILRDGDRTVFFAGDTSFSDQQLLRGGVPGISEHYAAAKQSLAHIRQFITQQPTVYLPSHDPQSAQRLADRVITTPANIAAIT